MSRNNEGDKRSSRTPGRQSPLARGRAGLLSSGTTASPGRLPTFRAARDLTLGGSPKLNLNQVKRVYTPNIPSRRVKEEPKQESPHEQKNECQQWNRQDRGRGRGRGRGRRGRPDLISSSSVFSLGPSQRASHQSVTSGHAAGGGGGGGRSTIKKERKDEWDEEESSRVLKMLQDTENDNEDEENQEIGMQPVQLPLSSNALKSKDQKSEALDAMDIKVKTEVEDVKMEDMENKCPKLSKPIQQVHVAKAVVEEVTCASLLSSHLSDEQEQLVFFQFPDSLPIKVQDEPMNEEQPSGEQTAVDKESQKSSKYSLKEFSEGYIGKLQVLKSGKTRLLLGDISLDVTMGTPCAFLQDLVSVHAEDDRSDMMVLGHLKHRLTCTPDFEKLLTKTS